MDNGIHEIIECSIPSEDQDIVLHTAYAPVFRLKLTSMPQAIHDHINYIPLGIVR